MFRKTDTTLAITTHRLRLLPCTPATAMALHRLWTTPQVRKYLWDDEVIPEKLTVSMIEKNVDLFAKEGLGLWGIYLEPSAELIGFCGYWYFHEPPELQLVYGLSPAYWKRGLAIEAATAVMHYGFEQKGLELIVGSTDAPNRASIQVMEQLGMTLKKKVLLKGSYTLYFSVARDNWALGE